MGGDEAVTPHPNMYVAHVASFDEDPCLHRRDAYLERLQAAHAADL